jgi:hypothetical protein
MVRERGNQPAFLLLVAYPLRLVFPVQQVQVDLHLVPSFPVGLRPAHESHRATGIRALHYVGVWSSRACARDPLEVSTPVRQKPARTAQTSLSPTAFWKSGQ